MAARDGASSIQGTHIRITPLHLAGSIDDTKPVLTTNGFITASFTTEFEDGDEITEKAADGSICITYKADDSLKRITFNLSLCSPDPEASALLAGGKVLCAPEDVLDADDNVLIEAGSVIGYSSPAVGDAVGNPVAVEIWSRAIVAGKPAAGTPYWHWVFPYVKVRYEGDREFTNGALANQFTGTGTGNSALVADGLNPVNADDDYLGYKAALVNPFSYVRATEAPTTGWSGSFVPTSANSIGCADSGIPTISGMSPSSGIDTAGGDVVVITGTNFLTTSGVTVGGSAVTSFDVVSATSISIVTPAHAAGTAGVIVTNDLGASTGTHNLTYA
jgi:hypothetical protein